ncbi:M81 family metallopeptidase [Marinibaculum pumilum]|uniref:Microcystinase C n=1 Tax=Marinibaculum pumilum TaxID=1766165 RepID=A0ABV7L1Y3_9PROT
MKVFIAGLATETNTFSPIPTGEAAFAENSHIDSPATAAEPDPFSAPLHVWRRMTEERQGQVAESICAFAMPAGRTTRPVYERLRDRILDDLKKAMPVDAVLLIMHGAMVADGYDDCEGDLMARIRAIVGPEVPIGLELDLHCHITEAMLQNATAIMTFKEYPHVDIPDRAADLFGIVADAASGRTKPVMGVFDCRMISMYPTTREPGQSFVAKMKALEGRDGILGVSWGHGFPWGDVAEVGGRILVVADGDRTKADALAEELGREVFAMRDAVANSFVDTDAALDRALEVDAGKPVVLADVADNAGGGAPSDSTFILQRILERGIEGAVSGLYWDPVALGFVAEAGEGATLDLRIGGKCGPASGDPLDLQAKVRAIRDGLQQHFGPSLAPIGRAAWLTVRALKDGMPVGPEVEIVLNDQRTQTFHPEAFTQLGIDLGKARIVVVKSSQHFHAGFAPIAAEVLYVTTPGAIAPDFAAIPYTKKADPFWPRVADPFAA